MRFTPLLVLTIAALLASAAPVSATAGSELQLKGSTGRASISEFVDNITVDVRLKLRDFSCFEETSIPVHLALRHNESVANATLHADRVIFVVPPKSYFLEPYDVTAQVNLTVVKNASAQEGDHTQLQVAAAFRGGDTHQCVTNGGFEQAFAILVIDAYAAAPAPEFAANATADGNGTAPPGNATNQTGGADGNVTGGPDANQTGDNATQEPRNVREPCPPSLTSNCGFIGEYTANRPPEESASKAVPAAPWWALALGVVAAALVARTRRGR